MYWEVIHIKDRIKLVRSELGMTQEEFAKKLNLSRNFIFLIEKGERDPSARTIIDICNKFGISQTWLETGEGPMQSPSSDNERIAEYLGGLLRGSVETDIQLRLISCLSKLSPDEWEVLYKLAKEWTNEGKKDEGQA